MANETASDGLGESATDEHNVLYVSMVTGWSQTLKGCVCVYLSGPLEHNSTYLHAVKESVDDDPVQWSFLP